MSTNLSVLSLPDGSPMGSVVLKSEDGFAIPSSVAISPDGREATVAVMQRRPEVGLADFQTGQYRTLTSVSSLQVKTMQWSPDGKRLAIGDSEKVLLWERPGEGREPALVRVLRGHGKPVTALTFSPDGATLASAAGDEPVRLWDMATGLERAVLPIHGKLSTTGLTDLAFTPEGRELRGLDVSARRVIRWLADPPNASP